MKTKNFRIMSAVLLSLLLLTGCGSQGKELRLQGISQLEKGQYQEAVQTLNEALQAGRGQVSRVQLDILSYRAEAEYLSGDLEAAEKTVSILIEADGNKESYEKLSAQISAKRLVQAASEALDEDNLEDARAKLDEAIAAGLQNDQSLEYDEAVYLEKTGKWEEAYAAMKDYTDRYPDDTEAARELDFLKTRAEALKNNPLLTGEETMASTETDASTEETTASAEAESENTAESSESAQ